MNSYFYFNDEQNEICFKRHDTPVPWINYLSNGTFHTMLSQAGGGVDFYKSPCHANAWAIIAECMLGRGERAYKYYRQLIPNVAMEKAGIWRYKAEPYVYSSNLFGPESDKFGLANVSWLTGTTAWMYVAATQYILGIRACWDGLVIDPCLPAHWKELKVEREFRGCRYVICILNRSGQGKGIKKLTVDGVTVKGNLVPFCVYKKNSAVEAVL